jgi:GAF domain-containing protein
VARDVTDQQYLELLDAVAEAAEQATGVTVRAHELAPLVADPEGRLGAADPETVETPGLATFLSMPLRAGGRLLGVLALSSAAPNAFGESALTTLQLIASPAAVVVDHARLSGVRA